MSADSFIKDLVRGEEQAASARAENAEFSRTIQDASSAVERFTNGKQTLKFDGFILRLADRATGHVYGDLLKFMPLTCTFICYPIHYRVCGYSEETPSSITSTADLKKVLSRVLESGYLHTLLRKARTPDYPG